MPVECRNNLAPFLLTGPPCRSMPTQKAVQCMTGMSLRLPWSELERRPVAGQASITVSKQPKGGWPRRWAFVAARPKWLPTALPPVRYEPSPITRIGPSGPPSYCVGFGGPRSLASRPGPCWPNNRAFTSEASRFGPDFHGHTMRAVTLRAPGRPGLSSPESYAPTGAGPQPKLPARRGGAAHRYDRTQGSSLSVGRDPVRGARRKRSERVGWFCFDQRTTYQIVASGGGLGAAAAKRGRLGPACDEGGGGGPGSCRRRRRRGASREHGVEGEVVDDLRRRAFLSLRKD